MAELSNEEIRSTLQDLVSSPDFNVNDPDTKKQLNNILSKINTYNYLNHNKNYMEIRCLSKEEYKKYLINGTCDGAVTKDDKSVFHRDIHPQNTNTFSIHDRLNIQDPGYYPRYDGTETMKFYEEIIENNIEHYVVFANQYSYHTQTRCKQGGISSAFDRKLDKRDKNYTYIYEQTKLVADSSFSSAYLTVNYYEYICYRPIFTYIDNNKSKNIYY